MTTNIRLLAMAAVAMLAMNSCVKEENLNNGENKGTPVEFEMGVNSVSRTETPDDGYTTTFVEGDEVGIFVYEGETPVVINAPYKLVAGGKWEAQGEIITAEEGKTYKYYAYYPYNAGATDATTINLTVASDQTNGYNTNDALIAKADVTTATTTVALNYSHAFALVQVNLKGAFASKDATVTLQNIYPTANINLISGTMTGDTSGTVTTVAMKACSTNKESVPFSYRAIVPAQKVVVNNNILTVSSLGRNYKFSYNKDVPYESGKLRNFDVTIGPENGSIMEISDGTIDNWENSAAIEDGVGNVGEAIKPTTLLDLSSLINTEMSFVEKSAWTSEKLTDTGDYWYSRKSNITTVSFDPIENAIKAQNTTDRGAWGTTGFGYHCGSKVFEKTTYRLTFDAKSTIIGNQVFGVCVRNSADSKGFRVSNLNGGKRNMVAVNFTKDEVTAGYKTITVDIDFTQASATTNLNDNTFEGSVDTDLNGITILFFNNLNQTESESPQEFTTYFKNIKFEKITE